ncbi:MAG: Ig-like domain-containing protein [Candidatus Njordarchaeia archaeon]
MKHGNTKIFAILLLITLLLSTTNTIKLTRSSTGTNLTYNNKTIKNTVISPLGSNSTFLGYFVRGVDKIKLNLTLKDSEGDPIPNAEISVYLNTSVGSIPLGSNVTDEQGNFTFEFDVLTTYPAGPANITAIFPGDPLSGLGEARFYYFVYIYARVFASLFVQKRVVPLFERNVSCSTRAVFDNGTAIVYDNLNFTIEIVNETSGDLLDQFNVSTDYSGIANFYFNFSSYGEGEYRIYSILNASYNNVSAPYVILSNQILLQNGTIIGEPVSIASRTVSVILASQVSLYFIDNGEKYSSLTVYKNSTIEILGVYRDASGALAISNITVLMWGPSFEYRFNATTNSSGMFIYTLNLNQMQIDYGLRVGIYHLNASDDNASTIDISNIATLTLKGKIKINILGEIPSYIMTGKPFDVEGSLEDLTAATPQTLNNVKVSAKVTVGSQEYDLGESYSDINSRFVLRNLTIPDVISAQSVELVITAEGPNLYYDGDSVSYVIDIYNGILLNVTVNSTSQAWLVKKGVVSPVSTAGTIRFQDAAIFKFVIYTTDNHERVLPVSFNVYKDDKLIYARQTNESGLDEFFLELNKTSTVVIEIAGFGSVELNFEKLPTPTQLPSINLWYALLAIPIVVVGAAISRFRTRIPLPSIMKEQKEDLSQIVNDVEVLLRNKMYDEAGEKIKELIQIIAKKVNVEWKSSMTPRELLYMVYPRIEKDAYRTLENLVKLYETIVYGEKIPDNATVNLVLEKLPILESFSESIYL